MLLPEDRQRETRSMPYQTFDTHADGYDAWFDREPGATIFAMEAACLQGLLHRYEKPYLEIGVGSGRFAKALGVEHGVDPALSLLEKAKSRGIKVQKASGENLPFPDGSFGCVLIALTLCFVDDPPSVLHEAWRVLAPGGGLVLGLILKGSPWAESYARKGREGHPLYSRARFFFMAEAEDLVKSSGFDVLEYRSILFQPPGQDLYHSEQPVSGYQESAGFVAIGSSKKGGYEARSTASSPLFLPRPSR